MATMLLGVVGAGIGSFFGMPGLGFTIASAIGNMFFGAAGQKGTHTEGPRLDDLKVQGSSYGQTIPIHIGRNRLSGQIIWARDIVEHATTTTVQSGGGKGGMMGGGASSTQTTYTYTATFALLLCCGPVTGFGRIWLDGNLFYDVRGGTAQGIYASQAKAQSIQFYVGDETQTPNAIMEAFLGVGNVPAYRGHAYVVFQDLQIDDYGRRIPNVTVEVFRDGVVEEGKKFEVVSGDYFWGDMTSAYSHVFTAHQEGILRVLRLPERQVRLLDLDGKFVSFASPDALLDHYGDGLAQSCGCLGGYTLRYQGNINWPLNGQHPIYGATASPPQIIADIEGLNASNLLSIVENQSEALFGFAVSVDQRRAMIVTCSLNPVFGGITTPSKWYLIHLENGRPVIEAAGSAEGLPEDAAGTLGIGNRALHGSALDTVGGHFHAASLELDGVHYWHVFGAGAKEIQCFEFSPTGVTVVYENTLTQNGFAEPTILADNGLVWVTNRYNVESFSRLPISAATDPLLSQVVTDLCAFSPLNKDDLDVSDLENTALLGYTISNQSSIRSALEPLMTAFLFDAVESNGKIKFVRRGQSPVLTIEKDNLAAHEEQEALPPLITVKRQQDLDLPKRVNISFINPDADYQTGTQSATRLAVDAVAEQTLDLPIVFTNQQAAELADTLLHGLWLARETHEYHIAMNYLRLEPSDVITINTQKAQYISRITGLEFGAPGLLIVQGVADAASVYTPQVTASGGLGFEEQILLPAGPTELHLMDIPIVRALDNQPGFYIAVAGYYAGWSGATVVQSTDNAAWTAIKTCLSAAALGVANNALSTALCTIPDIANVLNVKLVHGELASATDEQWLRGEQLAVVGQEIIQFRDAVLQADGSYTLSYFLRGCFGAEWAINTHLAYEPFTVLSEQNVQRVILDENSIGSTRYYKAVTFGSTVEAATLKKLLFQGVGLKPYAPVHLQGQRDLSGNLTITWVRRTRYGGQWRDQVDVPLGEVSERYEVDVLNEGTVVRTLSTTTPSIHYTTAQQTEDGFEFNDAIAVNIYQCSETVGRGFAAQGAFK